MCSIGKEGQGSPGLDLGPDLGPDPGPDLGLKSLASSQGAEGGGGWPPTVVGLSGSFSLRGLGSPGQHALSALLNPNLTGGVTGSHGMHWWGWGGCQVGGSWAAGHFFDLLITCDMISLLLLGWFRLEGFLIEEGNGRSAQNGCDRRRRRKSEKVSPSASDPESSDP